jgi:hypothetical protein
MGRHVLTEAELERGRQMGAALGGQAVSRKQAPAVCPRCGREMQGKSWHAWLGHLGLHGLADRWFQGDIQACQQRLRDNGRARQDPAPWNGAWTPYVPLGQASPEGS